MNHRLFVSREIVAKFRLLLQRLTYSRDIAVTEDSPDAGEEGGFASIAFHVLLRQETNEGLRHC